MHGLSVIFTISLVSEVSRASGFYFHIFTGDTCVYKSTLIGECVNPEECRTDAISDKSICQQPKVCCPTSSEVKKYKPKIAREGIRKLENVSFAVLLGYKTNYGVIWKCGGALIEKNVVLTAESCWKHPGLFWPVVIKTSLHEEIPIKFSITNSKYNGYTKLILANNSIAKTGCVTSKKFDGNYAKVIGFGTLSLDNMLHGSVYNSSGGMNVYVESNEDKHFTVQSTEGGRCFADHGGVAVIQDDTELCPLPIVGILSKWKNCEDPESKGYFNKVIF